MILSIDADKGFDKIQQSFMIKALKKLGKEGIFINIIKAIYNKPRANNILNGQQLKLFLMKIRNKIWLSVFSTPFNRVWEFLARAIRQEQEIKGIQI
jgi:hypothetical protein